MYANLLKKLFVPRQKILNYYTNYHLSIDSIKQRACWRCGRELDFWDYCSQFDDDEIEQAITLWQDDRVEFYCCKCFKLKESELKNKTKVEAVPVSSSNYNTF